MSGKILLRFLLFISAIFVVKPANAQLQFVQNKGQWDSSIAFKGILDRGAFAVTTTGGYKMLLANMNDLRAIHNHLHDGANNNPLSGKLSATSDSGLILHEHMYEVKFLNSNPSPQVVTEKQLSFYNNYFIGNDPGKWASNCKIYQAVTFKNVYPHIDVRYYTNQGQLKYDIIVNPGGNAADIALSYDGVTGLKIKNGDLHVKTSIDEITEQAPYSFQGTIDGREKIDCKYDLKGKTIRFKVDAYSSQSPLVIDPTLVFSTFTGSKADDWGYTATYDAAGNFYAGGTVFAAGFPVTPGAYQQNFAGGNNNTGEGFSDPQQGQAIDLNGFDMGILKFSSNGSSLLYATYIGGQQGNEQPQSMIVDNEGNLVIAGRTTSGDYPTIAPNLIGKGGGQDIVISKLNATGTQLLGSLRIGGTADDGVNIHTKDAGTSGTLSIRRNYGDDARSEVQIDAADNIYLATCTQSTVAQGFPVTSNAFQTTNSGSPNYNQDAVVMKFNSSLTVPFFISYLGGNGDDAAYAIDLNPLTNDIYVAGATTSTNFSTQAVAGTVGAAFQGGICDGFVAIISNDGSQLKKMAYIGTNAADELYGIQFDKQGFPYIVGTTEGSIKPINSPFNASNNQVGGKQFIAKLQPDLSSYVYMSTFGPANTTYPNISPTAFLVDRCHNVYVAGWGGGRLQGDYANSGTNGLTVQAAPDGTAPIKSTTDNADFYFFVLEQDAQAQLYGSFFGQNDTRTTISDHVDGGTSRFDQNGIIYEAICANCSGQTPFPTTPGAYSAVNGAVYGNGPGGYGCNEAAVKINMNLAGVAASIQSIIYGIPNDTIGCVPLTIQFIDTIGKAKKYIWNFGDGTPDVHFTTDTISHVYTSIGTFHVRLVGVDSSTCNIADTVYLNIKVGSNIITPDFTDAKVGDCFSLTYHFANTTTAVVPKYDPSTFVWDFGDGSPQQTMGYTDTSHTFPSAGTYLVKLMVLHDTTFCNIPDTITRAITIIANVKAQFTTPARGCVPYTAAFNNTSLGGTNFQWDFGDGATATGSSPAHLYNDTGTYTIRLIALDPSTCNMRDTAYFTITVVARPTAVFTYSPNPAQQNTPTQFNNESLNATGYIWNLGDGTISSLTDPMHQYNSTDTFHVCLIALNDVGCADTVCQYVPELVLPLLDVPNAFTPAQPGVNAIIKVAGFGIGKMDWKIYNRWGQLVFESTNKDNGWNGTFKGTLQPMDVYTYTLDVQFTNNKKLRKTGDISLLR